MLCRDSEEPDCRRGMLPDASPGQSPGSLASKLSRCKEGMARLHCRQAGVFAFRIQILLNITSVAVQFVSEPEIYQGAGFNCKQCVSPGLAYITNLPWCRSKSKNRDRQLTFIVRVSGSLFFFS